MLAQLNLNDYFIDEFRFAANRDHEAGGTTSGTIDIDFDISRSGETPLDFMISLVVDINPRDEDFERGEYRIHLKLSGFFSFTEGVSEDMINSMIAHNGLSILYGVARGTVADATATSWHGKFVLPGVNFIELIKQKAEAAQKGKKTPRKVRKK
jgi:preprotein translocase subunit SecB